MPKIALLITLIFLAACAPTRPAGGELTADSRPAPTVSPTPTATRIPSPTAAPTRTMTVEVIDTPIPVAEVTLAELTANLKQYEDQFLVIHGYYYSGISWPACEPIYAPITSWILQPVPDRANRNQMIQVKNSRNGQYFSIQPEPAPGQVLTVWGWLRFYSGPVGCGSNYGPNPGTPEPSATQPGDVAIWYVEATEIQ